MLVRHKSADKSSIFFKQGLAGFVFALSILCPFDFGLERRGSEDIQNLCQQRYQRRY